MLVSVHLPPAPLFYHTNRSSAPPTELEESLNYIVTFIEKHHFKDFMPEQMMQEKQNLAAYYNMAHIGLKFIKNSKSKAFYLKYVSYLFPDQFVLYSGTDLINEYITNPIIAKILDKYVFKGIVEKEEGEITKITGAFLARHNKTEVTLNAAEKQEVLRQQEQLRDIRFIAKVERIAAKIYAYFKDHSEKKPSRIPLYGHWNQLTISIAQTLSIISLDVKTISTKIAFHRSSQRPSKKDWVIKIMDEQEKNLRPKLLKKIKETAADALSYLFTYVVVSQIVSIGTYYVTRSIFQKIYPDAKEEEIEAPVRQVTNILWYGNWMPFTAYNLRYVVPTIVDIYKNFRDNFKRGWTIIADLTH